MSQESWMGMVGDEITADVRAVVQGTSEDRDAWRRTAIKAEAEIERLRAEWRMSDDGRIKAEEALRELREKSERSLDERKLAVIDAAIVWAEAIREHGAEAARPARAVFLAVLDDALRGRDDERVADGTYGGAR